MGWIQGEGILLRASLALLLIACRADVDIKPPSEDLSALICGRGIECSIVHNEQLTACIFCMDCFFTINGGKDKWLEILSPNLEARCPVVIDMNKRAQITGCIGEWQEGSRCGKKQ